MIKPTDRHGQPSRPWDVEELAQMDALRRRSRGPRVVRRVPTAQEQMTALFRQSDRWTKELVRELARLGYSIEVEPTDTHVYLSNVGRSGMLITLRLTGSYPIKVARVTFGRESWTARQATLWLRRRAARDPR